MLTRALISGGGHAFELSATAFLYLSIVDFMLCHEKKIQCQYYKVVKRVYEPCRFGTKQ